MTTSRAGRPAPPNEPSDDERAPREGPGVDLILQNAETLASVRARAEGDVNRHQRSIERVTAAIARPASIYAVLSVTVVWIAGNLSWAAAGHTAPDPPPFSLLQGCIGLGALLTAIVVLTTQMRLTRHSEDRAQLDLQVNLAAEQKTAKLIALVEELRRDLPNVRNRRDAQAEAMSAAVDPHAVMSALKETFEGHDEPPASATPPQAPAAR